MNQPDRSAHVDPVRLYRPVALPVERRIDAEQAAANLSRLLAAVTKEHPELVAFFACLYYAFLRPAEAAALTADSCELPRQGWGSLTLTDSVKRVGAAWTEHGTATDRRQLKHRARNAVRIVPIPPLLIAILREHIEHIERFGTAPDGRLFQVTWGTRGQGGVVSAKVYGPLWQKARTAALTKAQQRSPLAGRPYDLRHGGVTLALNAGVPAPEVATRAGHSVEVLWRVYAGCISGHDKLWNRRIDEALNEDEDNGGEPLEGPER